MEAGSDSLDELEIEVTEVEDGTEVRPAPSPHPGRR